METACLRPGAIRLNLIPAVLRKSNKPPPNSNRAYNLNFTSDGSFIPDKLRCRAVRCVAVRYRATPHCTATHRIRCEWTLWHERLREANPNSSTNRYSKLWYSGIRYSQDGTSLRGTAYWDPTNAQTIHQCDLLRNKLYNKWTTNRQLNPWSSSLRQTTFPIRKSRTSLSI